jgi:hypothetical protein
MPLQLLQHMGNISPGAQQIIINTTTHDETRRWGIDNLLHDPWLVTGKNIGRKL